MFEAIAIYSDLARLDSKLCYRDFKRCYAFRTFGLDLCPDLMERVVGEASLLFHISQKSELILVGIRVEKLK